MSKALTPAALDAMRHAPNPSECPRHPYMDSCIVRAYTTCAPGCHYRIPNVDLRVADLRGAA